MGISSIFRRILNQCRLYNIRSRKYCTDFRRLSESNPQIQQYLALIEKEFCHLKANGVINERFNALLPIVTVLQQKRKVQEELENLSQLSSEKDKGMLELVELEKNLFLEEIESLDAKLLKELLPSESDENRDVALEISPGVGGKEAMLFAGELYEMYYRYSVFKGWEWSVIDMESSDLGGLRHACVFLAGHSVFDCLRYESGVHRVQRIPATERSGRLHTSTVSVAVLPQPTEIEVELKDKDIKIETKRSSGAGGQHVNTTDSCVRITHLPTGIMVENQTERHQLKNKELALQKLRMKLYQIELDEQKHKITTTRKEQIGTSSRSEKVRTYNFNQDRITDHRIGLSVHNLKGFLSGGADLDQLIQKFRHQHLVNQFLNIVSSELENHQRT